MEGAVDGMSVHREDEPMSPLEPLDPHRIRDMVVDQHSMAAGGHLQRMQSMQCFQWSPSAFPALLHAANQSPIRGHSAGSSSNNSGSPAAQRRRLSSGSDSHSMQQQPSSTASVAAPQNNSFAERAQINFAQINEINSPSRTNGPMQQQMPASLPPHPMGIVPGPSPLGSPHAQHQSPFNRNTPGPSMTPQSPFGATSMQQQQQMQNQFSCHSPAPGMHMGPLGQQPQTPGGHNQLPSNQVNMSPSTNHALFPNPQTPRSAHPYSNQGLTAYPFPPNASQPLPGQPPQWMQAQQQMQQHYVGQPRMMGQPPVGGAGQRVMVQRVPYPTGYNPAAVAAAMTQAQPGYPRPVVNHRPQYPSGPPGGVAPAPPPLPPPQQPPQQHALQTNASSAAAAAVAVTSPPVVAYPPHIQIKEQQQQNVFTQSLPLTPVTPAGFPNPLQSLQNYPTQAQVPQAAMTPRTPQTPLVRPPLMNAVPPQAPPPPPPPQHITSPHSMFPSGSVTPSQVPPFTPRFGPPVQGVSPQYPNANDLRSPGLMSPTQAIRPQCLNDSLAPNMMRVATQSGHFFGHDVHYAVPLEGMCLMGCTFYLVENERNLNDKHDLANLSAVIKYHGGDLKWGTTGLSERTTHVLCESYQNSFVRSMLKDCRKRCVTLQWLNEVIIRKRMEAPWKFCHLPSFWNEPTRPHSGAGKSICVSGYQDLELINVKWMIATIGCRYSHHLSCENDFLIAKCESEKVEKARDWGVRVLNYRWLLDAYTGLCNGYPDPENPAYGLGTGEPSPDVSTTPYVMERHSDIYNKLMAPWKYPILVNPELFAIGMELRKSMENDENIFPFKKVKNLSPAPSNNQIVAANKIIKTVGEQQPKVVIFFSGILRDDVENLTKKAEFLGAEITTEVEKCTHFVCVSLLRTVDLMKAIALGKHIVSHYFIVYGYKILHFPDCYDLYLRDEESEKNYGYNLKNSIWRARTQPIFEDVTFHVMPSVHPSSKILCDLIRIAGGIIDEERPSPQFLADCIEYERTYFIIGCDADLQLYHYLLDCKFPIYNEEFVMMAIVRQEFDTSAFYLVNANAMPPTAASTPSTPNQSRLPPAVNGTALLQNVPPTPPAQQRVKAQ